MAHFAKLGAGNVVEQVIVVDNKDDVSKFKDYSGEAKPAAPPAEEKRSCPATMERPSSTPETSFPGAGRVIASPLAKQIA
jgi:pyruvate/2-oxoglutarate dehydrogenase complex dihydrolipoamide acyltransferase (E2) component